MKPWVDIEGSGELNTVIRSVVGNCEGTVRGTSNAKLRFLTVLNTSTQTCGAAIFSLFHSPRLTHVTAEATGAGTNKMGVYNSRSDATMTNVTATASGGSGNNYGVYNDLSSPTIRQSKLSGDTSSLHQAGISSNTKVALTQLVDPVTRQAGTLQCFNNYDQNMAAFSCP